MMPVERFTLRILLPKSSLTYRLLELSNATPVGESNTAFVAWPPSPGLEVLVVFPLLATRVMIPVLLLSLRILPSGVYPKC